MKLETLRKLTSGYYWASAGGNPLEVCEVTAKPDLAIYEARTIGCPDPFNLLDPECGLVLYTQKDPGNRGDLTNGAWDSYFVPQPLGIPDLPYHMGGKKPVPRASHGWRGPRSF